MNSLTSEPAAPLDHAMLVMDVADTLPHAEELAGRIPDPDDRRRQLGEKLKEIYARQGMRVSDAVIAEGMDARDKQRFVYHPPSTGPRARLARLYVSRGSWGPWTVGLAVVLALVIAGYFLAYLPYKRAQLQATHLELSKSLPAEMDKLYNTIYEETKVQVAVRRAEAIRTQGKAAAEKGDQAGADKAVSELTAIRDTLRLEYTLQVVNRPGVKSDFWTFPDSRTAATNYYIVVEAVGPDGKVLNLPVTSTATGQTETVNRYALRVPQSIYVAVQADKADDGTIQRKIVGIKQFGFLDVDYVVPVLSGRLTQW